MGLLKRVWAVFFGFPEERNQPYRVHFTSFETLEYSEGERVLGMDAEWDGNQSKTILKLPKNPLWRCPEGYIQIGEAEREVIVSRIRGWLERRGCRYEIKDL